MGWDHSLSCKNCKERLQNVARNETLNRDAASLDDLEAFLIRHADHDLIFDADDNYVRVPDSIIFNREDSSKSMSYKETK